MRITVRRPPEKYRPWSKQAAQLHIAAAIGSLTSTSVFHDGLTSPEMFSEEEAPTTGWWRTKTVYFRMADWWKPAYIRAAAGGAALNLARGVFTGSFVPRSVKTKPTRPQGAAESGPLPETSQTGVQENGLHYIRPLR